MINGIKRFNARLPHSAKVIFLLSIGLFIVMRSYQTYRNTTEIALLRATISEQTKTIEVRNRMTDETLDQIYTLTTADRDPVTAPIPIDTDIEAKLKAQNKAFRLRLAELDARVDAIEQEINAAKKKKNKGGWPF